MANSLDNDLIDSNTIELLAASADRADAEREWPEVSWQLLRSAGALAWSIPEADGGKGLPAVALLAGYERLASACLTTTFLLSQRDAAVRRLAEMGSPLIRHRWLPALARGDAFLTVGLSQLTTSRQHQGPALRATPITDKTEMGTYLLDGVIPWVSGAARADALVTGATLADGRQILLTLPTQRKGVEIEPSMDLVAVRGSLTGQVLCHQVRVEAEEVFAGPVERILAGGKGGGGLETSCLALGLAGAAIDFLAREAEVRQELRRLAEGFEGARRDLRQLLFQMAAGGKDPAEMTSVRVRANRLVLASTQAALAAAKGTGFARPHPAQRWARQALFFLVWSCPRPIAEGTLDHLLAAGTWETA